VPDLLMVRWNGLEPSRSCPRQPLKLVRLPIPPPPHKLLFGYQICLQKKKYLFTSVSLRCQQKTAISRELQVHAPAGPVLPVLPVLPERLAGRVQQVRPAVPELPVLRVRSSEPEQTWMT
jgi:hypothetical protein